MEGTANMDRVARRILAAMIVCGAILTALSFAMKIDSGSVKSRLSGLVGHSNTEALSR